MSSFLVSRLLLETCRCALSPSPIVESCYGATGPTVSRSTIKVTERVSSFMKLDARLRLMPRRYNIALFEKPCTLVMSKQQQQETNTVVASLGDYETINEWICFNIFRKSARSLIWRIDYLAG